MSLCSIFCSKLRKRHKYVMLAKFLTWYWVFLKLAVKRAANNISCSLRLALTDKPVEVPNSQYSLVCHKFKTPHISTENTVICFTGHFFWEKKSHSRISQAILEKSQWFRLYAPSNMPPQSKRRIWLDEIIRFQRICMSVWEEFFVPFSEKFTCMLFICRPNFEKPSKLLVEI